MDIYNKRVANGYLAIVEKLQTKGDMRWSGFLIRHVRQSGDKFRVADYWFKTNEAVRKALTHININDPVLVSFEIESVRADFNDNIFFRTSLRATQINKIDGARGKEWMWHVQDYMDSREVRQLKEMHPKSPLIIGESKEHDIYRTRMIDDIVERKRPFQAKKKINEKQDESNLPF